MVLDLTSALSAPYASNRTGLRLLEFSPISHPNMLQDLEDVHAATLRLLKAGSS